MEPERLKEYDIFVPLCYNDGTSVEAKKFQDIQSLLLERFGGVTFFPQPNTGLWTMSGVTYRDEIVIYHVLAADASDVRAFFVNFKEKLKSDFEQEDVLIIERDVTAI